MLLLRGFSGKAWLVLREGGKIVNDFCPFRSSKRRNRKIHARFCTMDTLKRATLNLVLFLLQEMQPGWFNCIKSFSMEESIHEG